jgi:NAD(P)H-hydrate epimerase
MVVGGSGGMTGAPLFASHAAMRTGAGIVWCGLPGVDAAAAAGGTEVVTHALPADAGGCLVPAAADVVLATAERFRAFAVGPGLGTTPDTQAAVVAIVARAPVPLVLDADGLNALGGDVTPLRTRTAGTVLTPHEGEYARLAGRSVGDDRVAAARSLAETSGAVVLLKGPTTVIAAADGSEPVVLNSTGNAALATAGSGDVLTGVLAGLLARGMSPFRAAAAGAWLHGRVADELSARLGTGVVAGDLLDELAPTLDALTRPASVLPSTARPGARHARHHAR